MIRTLSVIAVACAVAGCGESGTGSGSGSPDSAPAGASAPTAAAPTPAATATPVVDRAAALSSLPAPYNQGDLENGRRVFARCRSCHTLPEGGSNMTGPNLYGLFGRRAGTLPGYRYSDALKSADFAWGAEQLDEWLENPRTFLVGNKMTFAGIPNETDRRDVIAFLKVETGYVPPAQP